VDQSALPIPFSSCILQGKKIRSWATESKCSKGQGIKDVYMSSLAFVFLLLFLCSFCKKTVTKCTQYHMSAPLPNEIIKSSQLRKKQHLVFTYISENAGIEQ